MLARAGQTSIGKLRIAASSRDRITARLELERLLASADLQPPGIPATAVLCINKISAVEPARSSRISTDLAWQSALRGSLAEIAARAIRLSAVNTATAANAVVFGSWAELMACLARDWSAGAVADRWWWRAVLKPGESFWITWRQNSEYIPAALEHLARANRAIEVVARFTEAEALALTRLVLKSFGLRLLAGTVQALHAAPSESAVAQPVAEFKTQSDAETGDTAEFSPWKKHVPETAAPQLSREQQRFLGIALMIQRAPSLVRTTRFAHEAEQWQKQLEVQVAEPLNVSPPQLDTRFADTGAISRTSSPLSAEIVLESRPVSAIDRSPTQAHAKKQALVETSPSSVDPETVQTAVAGIVVDERRTPEVLPAPARALTQVETSQPTPSTPAEVPSPSIVTLPDSDRFERRDANAETSAISIETDLGGCLFLVNLALYLDLYGDFTSPMSKEIELNIWDFVALIGSELVCNTAAGDPIWLLLANLAGRTAGEPAGKDFNPESDWRLPLEWLSPFRNKNHRWKWGASRGRLRVMHPQGFLILDVPIGQSARAQVQHEIAPYGISASSLSRARLSRFAPLKSKAGHPSLRCWLSRLMPYVRARLRVALGLRSEDEIAAMLCRHKARVLAHDTHIDVYFALADLPLEIRFAGLDRDPGWVPAAGRFIYFHFD